MTTIAACRFCHASLANQDPVCLNCGGDQEKGPPRRGLERTNGKRSDLKEREIPLALFAGGFALEVVAAASLEGSPGLVGELYAHGVGLIVWLGLALIAGIVAGSFLFQTSFGSLKTATLKLAAVGCGAGAVTALMLFAFGPLAASLSGLLVTLCYFSLLMWLFEMRFLEAAVFSVVLILLQHAVVLTLLAP